VGGAGGAGGEDVAEGADAVVVGVSVGADIDASGVSVGAGDGTGTPCAVIGGEAGGEGAGARSLREEETVALGSATGARRRGGRGSTGIRTSSDWHGAHG
jgi:hypothetical protein